MFVLQNHSPDEELLIPCMNNLILAVEPTGMFGTVAALLASFTNCLIHDTFMPWHGWVTEVGHQVKLKLLTDSVDLGKESVAPDQAEPVSQGQMLGPLKVSQYQIWMNLLVARLASGKTDGHPLDVLLSLWLQMHPE